MRGLLLSVLLDEILALIRHAMMDGDPALERAYAIDVAGGDRLGVIDEPVQALQGYIAVNSFEHIERAGNRFVVRRVQSKRPTVLCKQPNNIGKLMLHAVGHVRARLEEVLEVGCRIDE